MIFVHNCNFVRKEHKNNYRTYLQTFYKSFVARSLKIVSYTMKSPQKVLKFCFVIFGRTLNPSTHLPSVT